MLTKEKVYKLIKENDIKYIDMGYMDYAAVTRIRTMRVSQLESAFNEGVNFFAGMFSFNTLDETIPDPTYGDAGFDIFAIPDPKTFAILPHRKNTARMFCDLYDSNGEPWEGCPRLTLKKLLAEAEEVLGGTINMAFEQEGYLLENIDGKIKPVDETPCFSAEPIQTQERFLHNFVEAMENSGAEIEKITSEYGPGQLEINLRYAEALKAADDQVSFMQLFKQLALQEDLIGTLVPKPFSDLPGSGLHVHLSLFNGKNNIFEDHSTDMGLSKTGEHFLAGLMKHARSLVAIGAPSINSYKRMYPGSFAPAHLTYSVGTNRSALFRVTEKRRGSRFEFRGADGTCNPHILASALVIAGLDGVKNELPLDPPLTMDLDALSADEIEEAGFTLTPTSLSEAMDELESSTTFKNALGPILEEFIKIKRSEAKAADLYISEWERNLLTQRF